MTSTEETKDQNDQPMEAESGAELEEDKELVVTAEESLDGEEGDDDSYEDEDDEDMPLLKYSRMSGSIERVDGNVLSSALTCSKMSRVLVPIEESSDANQRKRQQAAPLGQQQPTHVIALGFEDGSINFLNAQTGQTVISPEQLRVPERGPERPIVDITLDATGHTLAGINDHGLVCIWDLKYAVSSQAQQQPQDVFSNFLTSLGGQTNTNETDMQNSQRQITLKCSVLQASRISFPSSFGLPTCMVLDPSYRRRREKAVMVGFQDGKLILTKRGFMFQRRTDTVIYQGPNVDDEGIQALEWRGSMVAWADNRYGASFQ